MATFLMGFTMVVPVDIAELLLVLLTVLRPSFFSSLSNVALAALDAPCFLGAAFGRPGLVFSLTIPANAAVAVTVFDLLGTFNSFNGDVECAPTGFCGEPRVLLTGDCGSVRELADLGDKTLSLEFPVWWEPALSVTFARFLGFGT